jgi:hypothetical protein
MKAPLFNARLTSDLYLLITTHPVTPPHHTWHPIRMQSSGTSPHRRFFLFFSSWMNKDPAGGRPSISLPTIIPRQQHPIPPSKPLRTEGIPWTLRLPITSPHITSHHSTCRRHPSRSPSELINSTYLRMLRPQM